MFELCKKVEVYNIENNYYYYYGTNKQPTHAKTIVQSIPNEKVGHHCVELQKLSPKRGLTLSKSIDMSAQFGPQTIRRTSELTNLHYFESQPLSITPNNNPNKYENLRLRTDFEQNEHLVYDLYRSQYATPKNRSQCLDRRRSTSHKQKIFKKTKPVLHHDGSVAPSSSMLQKLTTSTQTETIKNLSDTRPPFSSKIESQQQNLQSRLQDVVSVVMRESFENEESKLITISKSVSSVHETINERDLRKYDFESENSKSGKEISFNLSNVFSKDEPNMADFRKESKSMMKRITLWPPDSQRYTIQSRFSRDMQNIEDQDIKVEQSLLCEHDPKSNFLVLPTDHICIQDFTLSQAIEKLTNFMVTIKEFITHDFKTVTETLYIHEIIEKELKGSQLLHSILQLYQIQRSQYTYFLIMEPYQMSLANKIKEMDTNKQKEMRAKVKELARSLLMELEKEHIFANRPFTINSFVVCMEQPKLHDVSIFRPHFQEFMSKDEVLAGLDW